MQTSVYIHILTLVQECVNKLSINILKKLKLNLSLYLLYNHIHKETTCTNYSMREQIDKNQIECVSRCASFRWSCKSQSQFLQRLDIMRHYATGDIIKFFPNYLFCVHRYLTKLLAAKMIRSQRRDHKHLQFLARYLSIR